MSRDGETSVEVPGVKPGEPKTRDQAQRVADELMGEWGRKHPEAEWAMAANVKPAKAVDQTNERPTEGPTAHGILDSPGLATIALGRRILALYQHVAGRFSPVPP